jgi:hypothetical protein
MSKSSNLQKLPVLRIWLEELKVKVKVKKKNPDWLKDILDEE